MDLDAGGAIDANITKSLSLLLIAIKRPVLEDHRHTFRMLIIAGTSKIGPKGALCNPGFQEKIGGSSPSNLFTSM